MVHPRPQQIFNTLYTNVFKQAKHTTELTSQVGPDITMKLRSIISVLVLFLGVLARGNARRHGFQAGEAFHVDTRENSGFSFVFPEKCP